MSGTPIGSQKAFGPPPVSTAPPVLKNPTADRSRHRTGSAEELHPAAYAGGGFPSGRTDGTAPPVLNRPTRTGDAVPPPGRGRPLSPAARPDRRTPAGADWVGADRARAEAGSPVLDAPVPPPTGGRASRLEEIPNNLRSRAATRAPAGPPARPGTVAPELNKRRTDDDRRHRHADEEAPGVIGDEQAFEVQTPGGAVVTGRHDEPEYEPEVRRTLGRP
jgi:hypothetical protein